MRNKRWQLFLFLILELATLTEADGGEEVKTSWVFWMLWSLMLPSLVFPRVLQTCWLLQWDFLTWRMFFMLIILFLLSLFFGCFCSRKTSWKVPAQELRGFKLLSGHTSQKCRKACFCFQPLLSCVYLDFYTIPGFSFDFILCFCASKGTPALPILPLIRWKSTDTQWGIISETEPEETLAPIWLMTDARKCLSRFSDTVQVFPAGRQSTSVL